MHRVGECHPGVGEPDAGWHQRAARARGAHCGGLVPSILDEDASPEGPDAEYDEALDELLTYIDGHPDAEVRRSIVAMYKEDGCNAAQFRSLLANYRRDDAQAASTQQQSLTFDDTDEDYEFLPFDEGDEGHEGD